MYSSPPQCICPQSVHIQTQQRPCRSPHNPKVQLSSEMILLRVPQFKSMCLQLFPLPPPPRPRIVRLLPTARTVVLPFVNLKGLGRGPFTLRRYTPGREGGGRRWRQYWRHSWIKGRASRTKRQQRLWPWQTGDRAACWRSSGVWARSPGSGPGSLSPPCSASLGFEACGPFPLCTWSESCARTRATASVLRGFGNRRKCYDVVTLINVSFWGDRKQKQTMATAAILPKIV